MPTQKKKDKKPKVNNASTPAVNIKQEPDELKPLSAYVDDRLELLRQVFSCVKPKEIKYLLPDFLEGKSNDIIKERCLDELLGISTKRLHSIITNAKCPTDTESSSENSDVEKIEEHISLDEISSDSDDDAKRSSKRNKKAENNKQPENRNGEPKSEKEMTVLELLELQARARAIRSQLALEPVTKIEIDSEHEAEEGRHGDVDTDDDSKATTGTKISAKNGSLLTPENTTQLQTKRVRLKRNFRIRKVGEDDEDEPEAASIPSENVREKSVEPNVEIVDLVSKATNNSTDEEKSIEVEKAPETEKQIISEPVQENIAPESLVEIVEIPIECGTSSKDDPTNVICAAARDSDRESSPEVIPVEASPETLCISSDSEEERLAKERASIFVHNIEELDRQAKQLPTIVTENPVVDTEPEEGEISEDDEPVPPSVDPIAPIEEQREEEQNKEQCTDSTKATEQAGTTEQAKPDTNEDGSEALEATQDVALGETNDSEKEQADVQVTAIQSLSSGSDKSGSDSESSSDDSTVAEEEPKTEIPNCDSFAQDDEDIVEIHDSGDENLLLDDKPPEEEPKSWNTRWLKSNRVAKVMAASRLGNKVREKLKQKKQIQLAEQESATDVPEVSQPSPKPTDLIAELPANVELGSVEHYRELVAQQENKDST